MDLSEKKPIPELSKRLKQTLLFIAWYFYEHSFYPTQLEIAKGIGLSKKTNSAAGYVEPLIKKGFLLKTNDTGKRKLRLTPLADLVLTETDVQNYAKSNKKR